MFTLAMYYFPPVFGPHQVWPGHSPDPGVYLTPLTAGARPPFHGFDPTAIQCAYLLTYFLTHPNRGDSLWQAFAGRSPGGGLQCLRRSHPNPTRAPGLSTALLSLTDALGNAITHRVPFLQRRRHRHR